MKRFKEGDIIYGESSIGSWWRFKILNTYYVAQTEWCHYVCLGSCAKPGDGGFVAGDTNDIVNEWYPEDYHWELDKGYMVLDLIKECK